MNHKIRSINTCNEDALKKILEEEFKKGYEPISVGSYAPHVILFKKLKK